MSISVANGFIRYMNMDGYWKIAVYSTLANATADAVTLNAAIAAGTPVVIGTDAVDPTRGVLVAQGGTFATPA